MRIFVHQVQADLAKAKNEVNALRKQRDAKLAVHERQVCVREEEREGEREREREKEKEREREREREREKECERERMRECVCTCLDVC